MSLPMLNGGGGDAHRGRRFADTAQCGYDLANVFHASHSTVTVQWLQERCAKFLLAPDRQRTHHGPMDTSEMILSALKARNVTHERIAAVLGVATKNATRLFNPDPKTGKPRKLSYDEGMALINAFGLQDDADDGIEPMSLPVARLAVQYVAQQLGVKIDPDDERVEDLALDIQAYSEFAASSQIGENPDRAEGWLDGRRSRTPARP